MSDFGVIRSHESEGVRFGKLFAEIYYYMGKNIIEAMGEEEGAKVIAKAVEEFGQDRVASMRAEAAERGIAVDSEDAYFMVRDMPGCGWENERIPGAASVTAAYLTRFGSGTARWAGRWRRCTVRWITSSSAALALIWTVPPAKQTATAPAFSI